ncbi:E3 ubiquitin-protein ligase RNF135-like isoform X2 [Eublepharis macularius]|uniref:E3 ubiquitin-protein ligase RNF135-like isoform X2 n=1 Tax=Eublepharis macularius TaxID=481883 RepID=A0AA97LLB0_EUBMA|nr:E3 ubiquitin-protein ligase RNF135-like isoform X2 [Eublepharis macularius]
MAAAAAAADPLENLQGELTCCICLDYFKHPVSIKKCSHSFCRGCITRLCRSKGGKAPCPSCMQDFGLNNLVGNRSLANVVEIVQQLKDDPGAWARKRRSGPELLALFGQDDPEAPGVQTLKLSARCRLGPLEDKVKINEISEQVNMIVEAVSNMRKDGTEMKDYVSGIKSSISEDFRVMQKHLGNQEKMLLEVLDQECRTAEQKIDGMIQPLVSRIDKLLDLQNNSEEMLKSVSPEQEVCMGSSPTADEITLDIPKISSVLHAVKKFKRLLLEMPVPWNGPEQTLQEPSPGTSGTRETLMDVAEHAVASSSNSSQSQDTHQDTSGYSSSVESDGDSSMPGITSQFSQWASSVTFDLKRIHDKLEVTKDKRRVRVSQFTCEYERSPKRFRISQVMGSPGFSEGRHYWEVNTKDSAGWAIGVAVEEIGSRDQLGRNELSWCIEWSNEKLSAWHKGQETQISEEKPLRVGTFLDIPQNCLSFYSCTGSRGDPGNYRPVSLTSIPDTGP